MDGSPGGISGASGQHFHESGHGFMDPPDTDIYTVKS